MIDELNDSQELLFEIYLLWLDKGFSPLFSAAFKRVAETSNPRMISAWIADKLRSVKRSTYLSAKEDIAEAKRLGIIVIHYFDLVYPSELRQLKDPPLVLFVKSQKGLFFDKPRSRGSWFFGNLIGIVGARVCSYYGEKNAHKIAYDIVAHGGIVISGLALGVDQAAHEGALEFVTKFKGVTCPTISVIGSGLCNIYPSNNTQLADSIVRHGGMIISEFGMFAKPQKRYFPQRNRIISGLSNVLIVVEARKRSGALITARCALEQGKEIFAVPGQIEMELSEGTNALIKQGAYLYTSIEDLIPSESGHPYCCISQKKLCQNKERAKKSQNLNHSETVIYDTISLRGPVTFEMLIQITQFSSQAISSAISVLELENLIKADDVSSYTVCKA